MFEIVLRRRSWWWSSVSFQSWCESLRVSYLEPWMVSIDHVERYRCNRRSVPTRRLSERDVRRCSTTIHRRICFVSTYGNAIRGHSTARIHLYVEKPRWEITSFLRTKSVHRPSVDLPRSLVWFSLSKFERIDFEREERRRATAAEKIEPSLIWSFVEGQRLGWFPSDIFRCVVVLLRVSPMATNLSMAFIRRRQSQNEWVVRMSIETTRCRLSLH